MKEGQYQDEIRQAWDRLRKEGAPPPIIRKKRRGERGKGLVGRELIEVIAFAARDAGMILLRKSPHRRSFYLKDSDSPFKLRISDHAYSKYSEDRHMSVIVNFITSGPMDSAEAIAKGRRLVDEYKRQRSQRMEEASAVSNGQS